MSVHVGGRSGPRHDVLFSCTPVAPRCARIRTWRRGSALTATTASVTHVHVGQPAARRRRGSTRVSLSPELDLRVASVQLRAVAQLLTQPQAIGSSTATSATPPARCTTRRASRPDHGRLTLRLNYTVSPDMSIQVYAQRSIPRAPSPTCARCPPRPAPTVRRPLQGLMGDTR